TAWPVVPPGSGTLNIMITKANAANTDSSGIKRALNWRLHRRTATYQNGIAPQYITAQVEGLKEPSGICILNLGKRSSCPPIRPLLNPALARMKRATPPHHLTRRSKFPEIVARPLKNVPL